MPFDVLFVCSGNICRSPLAEKLFRARIDRDDVRVGSAGTIGLTGRPIDGPSAYALTELGVDPGGHVARELTGDMVAAADLVLTADSEHRATIMRADPLAFRYTFTIREFARLGRELGPLSHADAPAALLGRVADVAAQRGQVDPAEPGGDDIGDPFGAPLEQARATAALISESIDGVVLALGV